MAAAAPDPQLSPPHGRPGPEPRVPEEPGVVPLLAFWREYAVIIERHNRKRWETPGITVNVTGTL